MGISIEAENAVEQSAARAAVSRRKQDAGYSLEISSIHRRVKQMMKSRTAEAEPSGRSATSQALPEAQPDLPPGWESRLDEASGHRQTSCKHTAAPVDRQQQVHARGITTVLSWTEGIDALYQCLVWYMTQALDVLSALLGCKASSAPGLESCVDEGQACMYTHRGLDLWVSEYGTTLSTMPRQPKLEALTWQSWADEEWNSLHNPLCMGFVMCTPPVVTECA